MWLDQNLTQIKACGDEANISYRIFEQTIWRQKVFFHAVSPTSRKIFETFDRFILH